jgi:chromosome segregation ATPase
LDAARLILGVESLKQRPTQYIFDGRGDSERRAERAYVKAILKNPLRSVRLGRAFADAGRGCEYSDYVTAVCEISRDSRRRYTISAGATTWGEGGVTLGAALQALSRLGQSHWLRPGQWSDLLARAGVSRALLHVISVKQGETDRTIEGSPEDLLKRMLELTGKQQTLEDFRQARAKLAKARDEHRMAGERLVLEQRDLERLKAQAARHEEYLRTDRRRHVIVEIELPTAHRRARERELTELRRERDQRASQLQQAMDDIEMLERQLPVLEGRLADLEAKWVRLSGDAESAGPDIERLAMEAKAAGDAFTQAQHLVESAATIVDSIDDAAVQRLERDLRSAARALSDAEEEHERLLYDIEQLEAGRPPRPDGLDDFRALLDERGISTTLIAEEIEVAESTAIAVEAALDRGTWTLVVPAERYDEVITLACESGYRLPLARAGTGGPTGAMSLAVAPSDVGAYLEEVDLPLVSNDEIGVTGDGLVRGRHWAHFRAPVRSVLGEGARLTALKEARIRGAELERTMPALRTSSFVARERASTVAAALVAAGSLEQLTAADRQATDALRSRSERAAEVVRELAARGPELGSLRDEVRARRNARTNAEERRADLGPRVQTQSAQIAAIEEDLARRPLTSEQSALGDLPPIEALQHELERVVVPRLAEYSDEERSPLAPMHRDDQALAVSQAAEYLSGREELVGQAEIELERARTSYDEHIRQTIQALNRSFREVCEHAGMEGEIRLEPSSSIEGEWALDVRVAHTPGEPKQPYQSGDHSGGQRAKISILLLLAAMSIEGSADLLIMDEHIAHLDSQNIDYVAEVMAALRGKVQFLLATPTNAEAARLSWCDHQLACLPRPRGEAYSPPIRLLTKMTEATRPGELELELDDSAHGDIEMRC